MGRIPKNRPTADEALQLLLEGNRRFVAGKLEHPNQEGDLVDNAANEVAIMIASQLSVSEPSLADFVNDN